MDLGGDWLQGYGVDSLGSGQGPVAGSCEYSDEPQGSGATELVFKVAFTKCFTTGLPHIRRLCGREFWVKNVNTALVLSATATELWALRYAQTSTYLCVL
jgi:hypothetical protein